MKKFKEQIKIPIPLLVSAIGLLLFIVIASITPFNNKLFSLLYPKPASKALEAPPNVPIDKVYQPLGVIVDKDLAVVDVLPGFPASNSGILKGDKIRKIDVTDLTATSEGLLQLAASAYAKTLSAGKRDFLIERQGLIITLTVSDIFTPEDIQQPDPQATPLPSGFGWF